MANQQSLKESELRFQNPNFETSDPIKIKEAEDFASRKSPSWVKLPNVNVYPKTIDVHGAYIRDQSALWVRLSGNIELGRTSIRRGDTIGWYKILYSTVTDPRIVVHPRVKWEHYIKDRKTNEIYLGLFSSPPNDVHDTLANAADQSSEIKEQVQRLIEQKVKSREAFDPILGDLLDKAA